MVLLSLCVPRLYGTCLYNCTKASFLYCILFSVDNAELIQSEFKMQPCMVERIYGQFSFSTAYCIVSLLHFNELHVFHFMIRMCVYTGDTVEVDTECSQILTLCSFLGLSADLSISCFIHCTMFQ